MHGGRFAVCSHLTWRPPPAATANEPPDAGFGFFPSAPVAGQTVRFVSYACDPDGAVFDEEWDLDGDGAFDDGFGSAGAPRVPARRLHTVALRVTPLEGRAGRPHREHRTSAPEPAAQRDLHFPATALARSRSSGSSGSSPGAGARIRFLSVTAPDLHAGHHDLPRGPPAPSGSHTRLVGRNGGARAAAGRERIRCGPASGSRCASPSGTGSGSTPGSRSGAGSHRCVWTAVSGSARPLRAPADRRAQVVRFPQPTASRATAGFDPRSRSAFAGRRTWRSTACVVTL